MSFPIRPGKVTCAGVVAILMVLPNSIWKGPDARGERIKVKIEKSKTKAESSRMREKLRDMSR